MVRAGVLIVGLGLILLLPAICDANEADDDDSFEVTEVAGDPAGRARQPREQKKRKKQPPKAPTGIHVTYKNADGEEKDLDDDLRQACDRADLQEIRKLLDIRKEITDHEGADIHPRDKYGNAPLHDAARQGRVEVAQVLLEGGHDANLENGMADRPLHMSAASGQLAMTKLLVEHGAEIDPQTSWGMTPMYWTANGGSPAHIKVARYLISRGADVSVKTTANYTMLHEAAREGHLDMCKLLLDAGIDGDATEPGLGETALHKAAAAGHADVVELLLSAGLGEDMTNKAGETPIATAHKAEKDSVVEVFMDRAARVAKTKSKAKKKKKKKKKKAKEKHSEL